MAHTPDRFERSLRWFAPGLVVVFVAATLSQEGSENQMMARSIDEALFVASGMNVRSFEVRETVAAPPERVYATFASGEALRQVYGPDSEGFAANIDLAIGGRYEWLFDGKTGSNGCQVLSYIPDRMISFSWNAPPGQPESRGKRTWVVVEVQPVGDGRAEILVTHLGFGTEANWDETFEYFQRAWPSVLEKVKTSLQAG